MMTLPYFLRESCKNSLELPEILRKRLVTFVK